MSGTKMTVGSRAQVWHGTAKHTSGGLTKAQLMMNKSGRIVSRKKHASAKRDNRLVKAGYKTKKGHFGFVKVGSRKRGRKGRKGMKGGSGMKLLSNQLWEQIGSANNPQDRALMSGGAIYGSDAIGAPYNGKGTGMSGDSINVQLTAGMAGGKRRKMRGGTGFPEQPEGSVLTAALGAASGGRRRKGRSRMNGGTGHTAYSQGSVLNAALAASS
jgi:hypothetical protein